MPKDSKVYLLDIQHSIDKILRYVGETSGDFARDEKTMDAVVRNLEIIGEAVKSLPETFRKAHPGVEWKKLAGLRDILIHEYFGVDADIIRDIVKSKLPGLKAQIEKILAGER